MIFLSLQNSKKFFSVFFIYVYPPVCPLRASVPCVQPPTAAEDIFGGLSGLLRLAPKSYHFFKWVSIPKNAFFCFSVSKSVIKINLG
nr:MAG TPA: hypothetical protein [Caudoviricetes sp.]